MISMPCRLKASMAKERESAPLEAKEMHNE